MDVIITGATGGIGSCIVKRAIANENIERVYCLYRNQEKFKSLFDIYHPKINAIKCSELFGEGSTRVLHELYEKQAQNIACVYSAFSINPLKRVGTYLLEEIQENICTNVLGVVAFINSLIQYKQNSDSELRVINFDSGAAYKPLNGWGMYSASKAYVNMFLKTVQLENPDVKIVSYEPGVVDTSMQKEIRKVDRAVFEQVDIFREYYDKKMLRDPDAIAEDIINRFIENWAGVNFREGYNL